MASPLGHQCQGEYVSGTGQGLTVLRNKRTQTSKGPSREDTWLLCGSVLSNCGSVSHPGHSLHTQNTPELLCHYPPKWGGARPSGILERENRSPSVRAPPSDSVSSTCSPGKKACRESIHVFISCPLNMFTLTYSGGSPSPSLQASRLRAPMQQPGERRKTDH